jgi:hypothetical protein
MKKTCLVFVVTLVFALALGCAAWASDASQTGSAAVAQSVYGVAGQVYSTAAQAPVQFVVGQQAYTVGSTVYNTDAAAFAENGRTLVPVRYLGAALGATTNWDAATKTVTLTAGNTVVTLVIGQNSITINGQATPIDSAPLIRDGRTYIPVRSVAEAFGCAIGWDQATQTVSITQE